MSIKELTSMNGLMCDCGKVHAVPIKNILCGSGVVGQLPDIINDFGAKKVFVLSDINTYKAAGQRVCDILSESGIKFTNYVLNKDKPEPDEKTVGSVIMHYDAECDIIVAVGSGVINDTGKLLATVADKPYVIAGTAPSMDGYASATSSMTRDGLKTSLATKSADVIIGDTDIMKDAPEHMLKAGLGDMLAKYVSICEWRIANLLLGEYYCEKIADLVRVALDKCVRNADGLLRRDEKAVEAVFEGLTICGVAMTYAGLSRPASGGEHYLSHLLDMRAIQFGTNEDLHGIQCAVATLIMSRLYEKVKNITPDREKALCYIAEFDYSKWSDTLYGFLGESAAPMIELEKKEGKYDVAACSKRVDVIIENWDKILEIIDEELPSSSEIEAMLDRIDAPKTLSEIGIDEDILPTAFKATKDIRDKYVLARLCHDLGIIDEII